MGVRIAAGVVGVGILLGSALALGLLGLVFWLGLLSLSAAAASAAWLSASGRRFVRRYRPIKRRFKDDQDYLDWAHGRGRWAPARPHAIPE